MCIVDYVMIRILKRLSDNINKTELFLSRSVYMIQFLHPIVQNSIFFGKHSLVFDDFCNLSATRVSVGTMVNAKNIKTANSVIDHFHCQ